MEFGQLQCLDYVRLIMPARTGEHHRRKLIAARANPALHPTASGKLSLRLPPAAAVPTPLIESS